MKKFWMAFAAVALIVAALPSCGDSDDPVTPPQDGTEDVDPNPDPDPDPETASFTLAVSNVTTSDFALTVTPKNYTGNYYVAAVSGAEGYTGEEIAEILIAQDIEDGIDLGLVDNEYVYNGAASIPSLRSLWQFTSGANVTVVVFGISATGEILTDVAVEHVQLQPLAESDFVLSIGEVTAATAQISVTGAPGSSFYLGVFTSSSISSFDKSELADVIISAFGEEVLDSVFTMPEDQTMGTVTFSGLTASTSFTAVLFGIDKETLSPTSATLTETFTTPAGGDTPVDPGEYAFGTVTATNPTNTTVDLTIIPADPSKPYAVMVEAAGYVNQFTSDAALFADEMAFYKEIMAAQNITGMTVYQLFEAYEMLYTGSVSGSYSELDPGTAYCAYAYYMNPEETLDGDIAKAYFTTTGTAATSVKTKAHRAIRNYVERPFERPVVLGAAVSNDIAMKAPAFGKVR